MHSKTVVCILSVIGIFGYLSNYIVVCDVDPSDTNAILLEQLRVLSKQLSTNEDLIKQQIKQIELQGKQLDLLRSIKDKPVEDTPLMKVLVSVACTALGFVALLFLRSLVAWLYARYNINPEMPQTIELLNLAPPNIPLMESGGLRKPGKLRSPADYLSCESGSE